MAETIFNTTEATPIMREVILPGVREFMNHATVLLKYFEREVQPSPTGDFIITYNKAHNNNAGSGRTEEETLPEARASKFGRATVGSKLLYTRAKWTGKVIASTQSKEAMINALVEEVKRATQATKTSLNRQLNGDERDALGFYVSGTGTPTVVVNDGFSPGFGFVGYDNFQSGVTKVDFIDVTAGEHVEQADLYITRGAKVATGREISLADSAGAPVNLDADAAVGDYFVLAGTLTAVGAGARQLHGIRSIISASDPPLESGGLQGTPVASVPEFAATDIGSDSVPVDLRFENMQRVLSDIDINADEGSAGVQFILTSPAGFDTYVKMCKDERIAVNAMKLDGGFTGVSFNGKLPLVSDKHTRRGAYFFINPSSLKLFQLKDLDWMDKQGTMFYLLSGGDRDGYGANLYMYAEAGTVQRNANGILRGVNMIW